MYGSGKAMLSGLVKDSRGRYDYIAAYDEQYNECWRFLYIWFLLLSAPYTAPIFVCCGFIVYYGHGSSIFGRKTFL